jgi:hypothetical protein
VEARKRYARYIAARYSAYDVYFIVSGEWHGEVRTRPSTDDAVRKEFIEIGDALAAADPHGRMVAIHPMTAQGSVREFNSARWMSFGDYQQNYRDLHGRVLESLKLNKPVVNSEYGYFLRDSSGDGVPDKDNSTSAAAIQASSTVPLASPDNVQASDGPSLSAEPRKSSPIIPARFAATMLQLASTMVTSVAEMPSHMRAMPGFAPPRRSNQAASSAASGAIHAHCAPLSIAMAVQAAAKPTQPSASRNSANQGMLRACRAGMRLADLSAGMWLAIIDKA